MYFLQKTLWLYTSTYKDICIRTNTEFVQMKHTVVQSPAYKAVFWGPKPSIFSVCGGKEREIIVQRNKRREGYRESSGWQQRNEKQKFCWYYIVLGLILNTNEKDFCNYSVVPLLLLRSFSLLFSGFVIPPSFSHSVISLIINL